MHEIAVRKMRNKLKNKYWGEKLRCIQWNSLILKKVRVINDKINYT